MAGGGGRASGGGDTLSGRFRARHACPELLRRRSEVAVTNAPSERAASTAPPRHDREVANRPLFYRRAAADFRLVAPHGGHCGARSEAPRAVAWHPMPILACCPLGLSVAACRGMVTLPWNFRQERHLAP